MGGAFAADGEAVAGADEAAGAAGAGIGWRGVAGFGLGLEQDRVEQLQLRGDVGAPCFGQRAKHQVGEAAPAGGGEAQELALGQAVRVAQRAAEFLGHRADGAQAGPALAVGRGVKPFDCRVEGVEMAGIDTVKRDTRLVQGAISARMSFSSTMRISAAGSEAGAQIRAGTVAKAARPPAWSSRATVRRRRPEMRP